MNTPRPQILILDDEMAIRRFLLAFLDYRGYDAAIAASAEEAEILLHSQSFAAAIVDIRLPGECGEAFICRVARLYPHMKFLIYTGAPNFEVGAELAAAGVRSEHVFQKPVRSIQQIIDALDALLDVERTTAEIKSQP